MRTEVAQPRFYAPQYMACSAKRVLHKAAFGQVRACDQTSGHDARARLVHVRDSLNGVVEAVTVLSAVAEDLVVLHPADHMLHPGTHLAVGGVVGFLA